MQLDIKRFMAFNSVTTFILHLGNSIHSAARDLTKKVIFDCMHSQLISMTWILFWKLLLHCQFDLKHSIHQARFIVLARKMLGIISSVLKSWRRPLIHLIWQRFGSWELAEVEAGEVLDFVWLVENVEQINGVISVWLIIIEYFELSNLTKWSW